MSVSPERTAELVAALEKLLGLTPKGEDRPKAVIRDGEIVRDAIVRVGPDDPNYAGSDKGVVTVKRSDFVTVNMAAYEAQQQIKLEHRRQGRMIDPARLGHCGPTDEED